MNPNSDTRKDGNRKFALGLLLGSAAEIFTSTAYDPKKVTFTVIIAGQRFQLQGFIADATAEDELDGTPLKVEDPPRRLKELTRIALADKYGDAQTKPEDLEEFDILTVILEALQGALTKDSGLEALWKE